MPQGKRKKGTIGILTGGGDVPGLNPAIRAVTIRAIREGWQVIGLRNGWKGLISMVRDRKTHQDDHFQILTEEVVNKVGRTGGTFLHTSRTRPSHVSKDDVPEHLQDTYKEKVNDLTSEVLQNLDFLGIDYLIPIGGDDTLSYGVHLAKKGVKVIAIPKTMDNDVPGTDYCIGFSTCITRTIEMVNNLRTTAGSHERILVIEVFGRYAGFTALIPAMAGAANRCVIPEYKFKIERLTELLVQDRFTNPSKYSVVIVSEGAMFEGGEMVFMKDEQDAYGHKKLGGIGDQVSEQVKELSGRFNKGKKINTINQRLGYLVRCGNPDPIRGMMGYNRAVVRGGSQQGWGLRVSDAFDSIVPMAFGNLALNLILNNSSGRLVSLRNGRYDDVPIDVVTSVKKVVDVEKYYNAERLRPYYESFESKPLFIMTSDY